MRTLLMVKHVQSGAAKARRRASWTASTVNCLDEPPQAYLEKPHSLVADVFSLLKKTAVFDDDDDDDEGQESPVAEYREEICQTIPHLIATLDQQQHDNPTTGGGSCRMARRSSWHASCSSQPHSSVNSAASQRSSQTFLLDLSSPQTLWTRSQEVMQGADEDNDDVMLSHHEPAKTRKTSTSRPRKLGGTRRSSKSSSDRSGSPNFLVVSSATMPVHDDWQSHSYDLEGASCVQLTAFGDVTTIGCEIK